MPGIGAPRPRPRVAIPPPTSGDQYNAVNAPVQAPPLTISAERDPRIDQYMQMFNDQAGAYNKFRGELAEGTDQDAVNAMMRERDLTSGMAKEAFEDRALSTGGVTGLASRARSQALTAGAGNASRTNASMAATGRQAQLQALAGATTALGGGLNAANSGNAALQGQQNFALNTWQAARSAADAQQRTMAARRAQDWQQLMDLTRLEVTG